MKIKIILSIFLLFVFFRITIAEQTMLIKGNVKDKSGKPLEVTIYFNEDGSGFKNYRISSSADGSYSNGIEGGKIYNIAIKGYYIPKNMSFVNIASTDKYKEYDRDLVLTKLSDGLELDNFQLFKKGKKTLLPAVHKELKKIRKMMKFHNIKVKFVISTADVYCSKGRTKKCKQLLKDRTKVFRNELFKMNFSESRTSVESKLVINKRKSNVADYDVILLAD